jgi:hypothetical protein
MKEKHMVISTYNCDPGYLIDLGIPYTIYDQSDQEIFAKEISNLANVNLRPNVGHSLSNVFEYITDNYDSLPDIVIFVKANVVPRHCTQEFFENNIFNDYFSHLFHLNFVKVDHKHSEYLSPGNLLEFNDSWYVRTKNHRLFCSFDEFYQFMFLAQDVPRYLVFSPGACYIVESERIRNYPKSFWQALNKISSYEYFPSEAFMVERLLSLVFTSKLRLQTWVNDPSLFEKLIENRLNSAMEHSCEVTLKRKILNRLSLKDL